MRPSLAFALPDTIIVAWKDTLRALKGVLTASCIMNVLMLAGPLFMLQVYDRVLSSHSLETLTLLSLALGFVFIMQAWFDSQRQRLLFRVADVLDDHLRGPVLSALVRASTQGATPAQAARPARDLEQLRAFAAGQGPAILADLPWAPLFLAACFVLHPWIGVLVSLGALLLLGCGWAANVAARSADCRLSEVSSERAAWNDAVRRNADTVAALGIEQRVRDLLRAFGERHALPLRRALDNHARWAAASRALRLALQSAVLAAGAVLVIDGGMNVGAMIAASILTGRALHPAEQAITQWSAWVAARASYGRLVDAIAALRDAPPSMPRPLPVRALEVTELAVLSSDGRPLVAGIKFDLVAGDVLGVVGPSGAGKTSLARALAGICPAARGAILLDGTDVCNLSRADLAQAIGYLSQDVGLFDSSIAQNIARLDPAPDPAAVLHAAYAAGAAGLIERMPGAYDRVLTGQGATLSAGERQRIGLARALYGDPFLVILDEPNANLDSAGEAALAKALKGLRARGAIAIVIAHRTQVLGLCNKILALEGGRQRAFGTREATLTALREHRAQSAVVPLRKTSAQGPLS